MALASGQWLLRPALSMRAGQPYPVSAAPSLHDTTCDEGILIDHDHVIDLYRDQNVEAEHVVRTRVD
jgi:hypothetical protein